MKASAFTVACLCLVAFAGATGSDRVLAATTGCQETFSSTYDMVQRVIFDGHGCTSAACHTAVNPAGGLDLSAGVSYGNLVDQPPQSIPPELYPGLARGRAAIRRA